MLHLVIVKSSAVLSDKIRGLAIIIAKSVSSLLVLGGREFHDT